MLKVTHTQTFTEFWQVTKLNGGLQAEVASFLQCHERTFVIILAAKESHTRYSDSKKKARILYLIYKEIQSSKLGFRKTLHGMTGTIRCRKYFLYKGVMKMLSFFFVFFFSIQWPFDGVWCILRYLNVSGAQLFGFVEYFTLTKITD